MTPKFVSWWIQDFPEMGVPTLGGGVAPTYDFSQFSKKRHEIKRPWEGRASKILLCMIRHCLDLLKVKLQTILETKYAADSM